MRRRLVTAGALLVLAAAVQVPAANPVDAHSEIPGYRHVVDAVEPALPGVRVDVVVTAAAQVVVTNETPTVLEVVAEGGEGFLRISGTGVEANVASPDWYRSATPEADGRIPASAAPGAPPSWVLVSGGTSWGWFDHRLHRAGAERPPPRPAGGGARPGVVRLESWVVPMRYGSQDVAVRGHREFVRPPGAFRASLSAEVAGVRAGVVDGPVPAVSLAVPPGRTVVVFGEGGEPMARVGAGGPEANLASPTWRLTAASRGAAPDGPIGAAEPPRWQSLGAGSTLTWLEPRARYPEPVPPRRVVRRGRREVVLRWSVPISVDERPTELAGTTEWVPERAAARGGDDAPAGPRAALAVASVAAVLVATGASVLLRRRRRRPTGGPRGR